MTNVTYTQLATEKLLNGDFASGKMTGRVGVEIVSITGNLGVSLRYFLLDEKTGEKLWVSDIVSLKSGSTFQLDPVWMDIDVVVSWR